MSAREQLFRWSGANEAEEVVVEVCRDVECRTVLGRELTDATEVTIGGLPTGSAFWRVVGVADKARSTPMYPINIGDCATSKGSHFGRHFDVNRDGIGDIAIGFPGSHEGSGHVDLFLGIPAGDLTLAKTLRSPGGSWGFGVSTAAVGDTNGDGHTDLLVGSGNGFAYLYRGGAAPFDTEPCRLSGQASFGSLVAPAGDVNGDGYADAFIADPHHGAGTGALYVYLGGKDAEGANCVASAPPENGNGPELRGPITPIDGSKGFSERLATGLDLDGDGYSDLVVGSPNSNAIHVYWGGANGLKSEPGTSLGGTTTQFKIATRMDLEPTTFEFESVQHVSGQPMGRVSWRRYPARFGASIASVGDVNRDGFADVAVSGSDDNGTLFVFFGGKDWRTATPAWTHVNRSGVFTNGFVALPGAFPGMLGGFGEVDGDGDFGVVGRGFPCDKQKNQSPVFVVRFGKSGPKIDSSKLVTCDFDRLYPVLDVNADGRADALMLGASGIQVWSWKNREAVQLKPSVELTAPFEASVGASWL